MIVVIQCAARKRSDAGYFRSGAGKKLFFVADPTRAPRTDEFTYAWPGDPAEDHESWREKLVLYNRSESNPFTLYPAFQLYEEETYND